MASEESFIVLVRHRGSIKRKTRSGVKFTDKDPLCIFVRPTTSYDDLVSSVLQKHGLEGVKRVKKFFYRIPISVLQEIEKCDCFTIGSDEDLQVLFHCRRQFSKVRTPELLAKLVDLCVAPAGLGDALLDDRDDNDVEPDMIADTVVMILDREGDPGEPANFGARDVEGSAGLTEFQVGQQFQDKDEAVLIMKTYSIRRGVQYKVVESDYHQYFGKCTEFGNGCTWLI
ncbi:uncharacterized protein LOC130974681 [Arachis stenosperma]|uniref:uncharacterized protein LOC130974681 n=1 Tax=Arachis stenosperma TaxID=217475 RepID=UPI0025AB75A0|nr:uncharacterized protein LOC130974681 [Arachis stenosperma]